MKNLSFSPRLWAGLSILAIFLALPALAHAQAYQDRDEFIKGHVAPGLEGDTKEKTQFVYAFYKAYMYGVIYPGHIDGVLRGGILSKKIIKRIEDKDVDVVICAQDCGVEELKTLYVEPLKDDWFKVTFHRFTGVQTPPDEMVEIHVKLEMVPFKKREKFMPLYKIADLVNVHPTL